MKHLGGTAKLKGSSFYGKMIEDLGLHKSTIFALDECIVDKALKSLFFDSLGEIDRDHEIKEFNSIIVIVDVLL